MSQQEAKRFLADLQDSNELRDQAANLADAEEAAAFAGEHGYDFTEEELASAMSQLELSVDDLDSVSGGSDTKLLYHDGKVLFSKDF